MKVVIDINDNEYKGIKEYPDNITSYPVTIHLYNAVRNGTPLNDLLQRLHKRISDLYNTDVTYDNGDYNTMDTPTLDKVLEYFDSEVNT